MENPKKLPPLSERRPMLLHLDPELFEQAKKIIRAEFGGGADLTNVRVVDSCLHFLIDTKENLNAEFQTELRKAVAKSLEVSVPSASAYAYRDGLREAGIADAEVLIDPGPPIGPVVSFKNRLGQKVVVDFRLHHADPKITKRWEAC